MSAEEKAKNQAALESHLKNTVRAREEKEVDEEKAAVDPSFDQKRAATFDLQQVIFLPKKNRSEVFYKRRLSCYNLTVYDLVDSSGILFFL